MAFKAAWVRKLDLEIDKRKAEYTSKLQTLLIECFGIFERKINEVIDVVNTSPFISNPLTGMTEEQIRESLRIIEELEKKECKE